MPIITKLVVVVIVVLTLSHFLGSAWFDPLSNFPKKSINEAVHFGIKEKKTGST